MTQQDFDSDDITLEMQLQYIERLPVMESQDLKRFKNVANPSYHLTTLKKSLLEKDVFLQALQWLNKNLHQLQQWGRKISKSTSSAAEAVQE